MVAVVAALAVLVVVGLVVDSLIVVGLVGFAPMDTNVSDCCLGAALGQSQSQ